MRIWKQRKEQVPALQFIASISPPGYPSAWLRPRRACFHFARQDHCSCTPSIGLNFGFARHPTGTLKSVSRNRTLCAELRDEASIRWWPTPGHA